MSFDKFKKVIPQRVVDAKNSDRIQLTISVTGLVAKALYASFEDVSGFIEHCINATIEREGAICTPDGVVSKKQAKLKTDETKDTNPVAG